MSLFELFSITVIPKKFEKILKKCRSNRPLLLLAKCTSLLAGFFSSSSGTKRDCSVAGSFLRLLEKELKNRGAKRKIGSEVGEILTQTLLSWDEVENQVVFQPVVWPNSHINIKGIDNNDYRVSQQNFTNFYVIRDFFRKFKIFSWHPVVIIINTFYVETPGIYLIKLMYQWTTL